MVDYNENMSMTYYTESKEIEIVENFQDVKNRKYHFYFRSIFELKDLLESDPKIKKELLELWRNK